MCGLLQIVLESRTIRIGLLQIVVASLRDSPNSTVSLFNNNSNSSNISINMR
ncbi:hypothetical protein Syun_007909 [Stephania yunnanensis]|uniref:Uncharacterized protein n=1 Tax=Stephania yunnanensis TaxID=152371 RepID=A0AAP0L0R8_9MAGN